MFNFVNTLTITIVILINEPNVWARVYEECLGVTEPDTVVASKRSCAKYIFCDGPNSFEGECLGGNYFNELGGICDDPINVKCDIVESESVLSIYDESKNKPNGKDKVNLTSNIGDENENSKINMSNEALVVIEENNELEDNNDNENDDEISKLPETSKCFDTSGTKNNRRIEHSDSCSAFYICYNGLRIPMLCPRNLYFNAETQKCEKQMPKTCKLRYSVRQNCRKGVYDYMPHPQRCEYYYYCLNGFLLIMRCPNDFTWQFERRTCIHKSQSKCYVESSILAQQPAITYRSYSISI